MPAETVAYPLTAAGVRTRVLEAGEGERTLLFVHGLGARADRWRRNLGELADAGWRCLALDLPGHGFADKGPGLPATVRELSAWVAQAARELEVRDAVLVGTSLGAHVLGRAALDGAIPARGLMLVGPLGLFPLEPDVAAKIRASVVETSPEAIRRKIAFVMRIHDGITPGFLVEEHRINTSAGAHEAFKRLGDALVRQPAEEAIGAALAAAAARLPLSIVWGALDEAVPARIGEDAHRLLGLPAPVLIDGAGHAPYFERPDAFNRLLAGFAARAFGAA